MKHVAVVAVAMECIAAAAQIDQSYSPGGANVHTYIWFLGPHGFTTERYLDLFRLICKANLFSDPQILRFTIFLSWPDTPQKCLDFFRGGIWTPQIQDSLGRLDSAPNGNSIGSAVFVGLQLTRDCVRHPHRPRCERYVQEGTALLA